MKRLAVLLSIAFATLMAFSLWLSEGLDLLTPVSHYRQTLLWMSEDTLTERLRALVDNHRLLEARFYQLFHSFSLGFVLVMALGGLSLGWINGQVYVTPKKQARLVVLGFLTLLILTPLIKPMMAMAADMPHGQIALVATPLYWLVNLLVSASVMGLYTMLLAHDLAFYCRDVLVPKLAERLKPKLVAAE